MDEYGGYANKRFSAFPLSARSEQTTMKQIVFFLWWLALALLATPDRSIAQTATQPIIELTLSQTKTIPTQPVELSITVLVPTWLSRPVAFPTFEAPNLMVRVFGKATTPTSRTVEGQTWTGVTRSYYLYPMVAGTVRIAPQDLRVLWANPGKTEPIEGVVKTKPLGIIARLPPGAENLDPFIPAQDLKLIQTLSDEPGVLKPGDSFTRDVTAQISGTSPMFLPGLLPTHDIQGVASYPTEREVLEEGEGQPTLRL